MKAHPEKGFTLAEVIIAIAVLSIGLVGAYSIELVSVQNLSHSDSSLNANLIADYYLKELKTRASVEKNITTSFASAEYFDSEQPWITEKEAVASEGVDRFLTRGLDYEVIPRVFEAEAGDLCYLSDIEAGETISRSSEKATLQIEIKLKWRKELSSQAGAMNVLEKVECLDLSKSALWKVD